MQSRSPHTALSAFNWKRILWVLVLVLPLLLPALPALAMPSAQGEAPAAAGQIQGIVFYDANVDGVRTSTAGEPGIAGVEVRAYSNGTTQVGATVTTSATGAYAITGLSTGQKVRLEFTVPSALSYLRAGFMSASLAGTSVVFATENSTGVNVGFQNPSNYVSPDTFVTVPNALLGPYNTTLAGSRDALWTVRRSWGGNQSTVQSTLDDRYNEEGDAVRPMRAATFSQIGTTWGTAWNRSTNYLYLGAYMKLHTGFGPSGPGAIYRVAMDPLTGQPTGAPSLFVDIDSYAGVTVCGTHNTSKDLALPPQFDPTTADQVGKCALGDLDISEDDQFLYVMNLASREILKIATATGALSARWAFPTNQADCVAADVRPFALKSYNGQLYAGAVCSAETSQDSADFRAYVYRVNPSTGAFTQIFNTPESSSTLDPEPWNEISDSSMGSCGAGPKQYMLSDIEFYGNDLTLGFRDRHGDVTGNAVPGASCDGQPRGEITCAAYNATTGVYTLEANNACGSRTNNDTTDWDQPEGEFFYRDGAGSGWTGGPKHDNTSFGGLVQFDGGEVAMSALTPLQGFNVSQVSSGGLSWHDNENGNMLRSFTLYRTSGLNGGSLLGKANGLGDVEVISAPAPVEIGNYLWNDADQNGYQDPNEAPISGINVQLYTAGGGGTCVAAGTLINTSATNANGVYRFTSALNPRTAQSYTAQVLDTDADTQAQFTNGSQREAVSPLNNSGQSWGAVRFNNLQIPAGSTITGAYIQFNSSNDGTTMSDPARVRFYAQDVANAPSLEALPTNALSSMAKTAANVTWNVPTWIPVTDYTALSGPDQRTPNLSTLVQAVVNKAGWASGNAITLVWQMQVDGLAGERRLDDNASDANLIVTFTPPVTAGQNASPINPGCAYEVRISTSQGAIGANGWAATTANVGGNTTNNWNTDLRDSDFTQTGSTASATVTIGAWGENNHSLDAGFAGIPPRDFGDAPDIATGTATGNYNTVLSDSGPYHTIVNNLFIGAVAPDSDPGTLQNATALADDASNTGAADDEDGITASSISTLSTSVTLNARATNQTGSAANLACWIDFNRDGDFLDPGERQSATVPNGANNTTFPLTFSGFGTPVSGFSYIRCRLATAAADVANPTGAAATGEVEDIRVNIVNQVLDYGDAPDTAAGTGTDNYETTEADNGPRHIIVSSLYLGSVAPDSEDGSLQDVDALADDDSNTGAADDEDGVATLPVITQNDTTVSLTVVATNSSGSGRTVACWIDFNRDGDFVDTGERAQATVPASSGTQPYPLSFTGFASPTPGTSYLRCRVGTSADVTAPTGLATVGEVEDYRVEIYGVDFGDAPDAAASTAIGDYNTTASDGGPSHLISSVLRLGNKLPDGDNGTLQNVSANADDATNTGVDDDEDGITSLPIFDISDTSVTLAVNALNNTGSDATVACWIDFNRDGDFLDTGERAQATVPTGASLQAMSLVFSGYAPSNYSAGASYIRCRISSTVAEVVNPTGAATSGEVEDYRVVLRAFDYGDAPDAADFTGTDNYQTTEAQGGPRHQLSSAVYLGASSADGEDGTLQNISATADDASNTGKADDEDGIPTLPSINTATTSVALTVLARNTAANSVDAYLACWIDFNRDGDFDDAGEGQSAVVPNGSNNTPFTLTFSGFEPPVAGNSYIRCRISTSESEVASPVGTAYIGEVEDHRVFIKLPAGAIGNIVWVDENSDGYQDAGEPGIPNVRINLYNAAGVLVGVTYTDSHGGYLFSNLPDGAYYVDVVEATLPAGMTQSPYTLPGSDFGNQDHSTTAIPTTALTGYAVTIGNGQPMENLTADFGYNYNPPGDVNNPPAGNIPAALGDRVWIDADGDGRQDPNEVGVSGVTVTLYTAGADGLFDTADDVVASTTTTKDTGYYLFDGLAPGAYVVKVTSSAGASHNVLATSYAQTGDPDHFGTTGSNNDHKTTTPVVLGPGDVFLNADFGYQPTTATLGSLGDTLWFDADADGTGPSMPPVDGGAAVTQGVASQPADTAETPIPGVTVALIRDKNVDRIWDPDGADNAYGTADDEPIIATTTTNANGQYLFSGLQVNDGTGTDDYLVWVNDTANVLGEMKPTYDFDAGSAVNGIPTEVYSTARLGIAAVLNLTASPVRTRDFGYTSSDHTAGEGLIGDTVWFDLNNSGGAAQEAGEPGIEGVLMELLDSSNNLIATVTTDENGHYAFGGLAVSAGGVTYTVRVAASNFTAGGVLQNLGETYAAGGALGGHLSNPVNLTTVAPINLNQDFSYVRQTSPLTIGNLVWLDQNANGGWTSINGPDGQPGTDDDEPPIGDVTMDLYRDLNANGRVDAGEPRVSRVKTAATIDNTLYGANGVYLFTGLAAGSYVVDVSDENGVLAGYWHSLGTVDTNQQSQVDPYGLTIAGTALRVDFGYYVEPAAVGNRVWYDPDNDGLQDSGELGIDGIRLQLTILYPNGVTTVLTTVTGNNPATPAVEVGWYSFGNLLLDEDYNASTAGVPATTGLPKFTITAPTGGGYVSTLLNQGSNDMIDADNPAGVVAMATQGLTQVDQNTSPAAESNPVASYDFGYYATPLAVTLASFEARAETNAIVVTWETVSEVDNAGFTLYRSAGVDGERVSLGFTPAAAPGSTQGASYSFVDSDVVAGQPYFYWLEALDVNGSTTLNGPVGVTMGAPTAVTLSGLQAASDPATPAWAVVLGMAILGLGLLAARQRRQA